MEIVVSQASILEFNANKETFIDVEETWQPSVKLRYLKQENNFGSYLILQQLHVSNLGNEMWIDVEII